MKNINLFFTNTFLRALNSDFKPTYTTNLWQISQKLSEKINNSHTQINAKILKKIKGKK